MSKMRYSQRLEPFLVGAAYLVLALLAIRGLLPQPGTLGHAVDWYVAADPAYLARGFRSYLSMWTDTYLGSSGTLYAYNYPLHILLMAPGVLGVSGNAVSKLFVLLTLLVSAYSAYYLASYIASTIASGPEVLGTRRRLLSVYLPSFLAGCLYGFGPTAFGVLLSGAPQLLSTYAIAPLAFLLFLRAMREPSPRHVILASITGAFMVASIQLTLLLYVTLPLMVITSPQKRKSLIALGALLLLLSFLMMYWILPVVSDLRYTVTQPLATEEVSLDRTLTWLDTRADILPRVLTTEWYLKRAGTTFSAAEDVPAALLPIWTVSVYLIVVVAFSVLVMYRRKSVLLWMSLMCLVLVGFSGGNKSPIHELVSWAYVHGPRPLMGLFRYPVYWILLVPLYYAALFGCVGRWGDRIFPTGQIVLSMILVAATMLWMVPFWDGVLGNKIDVFRFPPELTQIDRHMLADREYGRALYLPTENAVLFEETTYQQGDGFGGKDTILALSPRPTLSLTRIRDYGSAEVTFLVQDALLSYPPPLGISTLLGMTNVKYIVLRDDVRPVSPRVAPRWDWATVNGVLGQTQDQGIELMEEYPHMSLWRNNDWWPHVYAASDLVKAPVESTLACLPDIAAYFSDQRHIAVFEDDIAPGSYQYLARRNLNEGGDNECVVIEREHHW